MNIYFSGIGGVGIGPLAEIAVNAGHTVFGSDPKSSLTTQKLESKDIEISIGEQTGEFLQDTFNKHGIDWFVYTSALPEDHPELVLAKSLGIKTSKRDELLNEIIREKNLKLIAIAGTHGKTSTSGLMVWVLKQLNIPVSWSVGTTLSFGESGTYNPDSELFIYEADEYDRNFLHFSPFVSLITSLDYDHMDIYKTQEDYFEAFHEFAKQSDYLLSWEDQHGEIFKDLPNSVLLRDIDEDIVLPGDHTKRNASLIIECLEYLVDVYNFDFGDSWRKKAIAAINDFPGVDRRFEKIANGIYSDYGHHPAEIKSTLQAAHEVAKNGGYNGVALIYQPHQNVRQTEVKDDYTEDVFDYADKIIWLPTFLSREDPKLEILNPEFLSRKLPKDKLSFKEMDTSLKDSMNQLRQDNMLILAMSAGSLDEWIRNNKDAAN